MFIFEHVVSAGDGTTQKPKVFVKCGVRVVPGGRIVARPHERVPS